MRALEIFQALVDIASRAVSRASSIAGGVFMSARRAERVSGLKGKHERALHLCHNMHKRRRAGSDEIPEMD